MKREQIYVQREEGNEYNEAYQSTQEFADDEIDRLVRYGIYQQRMQKLRRLFNRIPDDVVVAAMTHANLDLSEGAVCLLGWTLRECIARCVNIDAEDVDIDQSYIDVCSELAKRYGGTRGAWHWVYIGVSDNRVSVVELAWTRRFERAMRNLYGIN